MMENLSDLLEGQAGGDADIGFQSEDDDLYAGLQCGTTAEVDHEGGTIVYRQQKQQIQELQDVVNQKDQQIAALQHQLQQKDAEAQRLSAEKLVLLTNISSLFKTAQAEIKRHTTQLHATRVEVVQLKTQVARTQQQQGRAKQQQQQAQKQQGHKQQQQQQQQVQQPKQQQTQQQQALLQQQESREQQPPQQQARHQHAPLGDITAKSKNQQQLRPQQQTPPHKQVLQADRSRDSQQTQQQQAPRGPENVQQQQQSHSTLRSPPVIACKRSRSRSPVRSKGQNAAAAVVTPEQQQQAPSCTQCRSNSPAPKRSRPSSTNPSSHAAVAQPAVTAGVEQSARQCSNFEPDMRDRSAKDRSAFLAGSREAYQPKEQSRDGGRPGNNSGLQHCRERSRHSRVEDSSMRTSSGARKDDRDFSRRDSRCRAVQHDRAAAEHRSRDRERSPLRLQVGESSRDSRHRQ